MAAADAGHRSAEPFVLGVADLIDQKPRPKREGVLLEIASRGTVATSHGVEKINGRADAVTILLVHRLLYDFARRARLQSAPHMTVETHFEEAVGVLDRARLGDHNKEALLRNEKEINDVERDPGTDVEQDEIGVHGSDTGQESDFLSIFQIRRGEMVVCAADESEVLDAGLENHVVNRLDAPTDEIAQRERRRGQAQASMEIRPAEVGVDHDHFLAVPRHGDPKAARNEALANAAFAAANCNDATFGGLRFLARCRRNDWMHDRRGRGFGKGRNRTSGFELWVRTPRAGWVSSRERLFRIRVHGTSPFYRVKRSKDTGRTTKEIKKSQTESRFHKPQ